MHPNIKDLINDFIFEGMLTYITNSRKARKTAINNFFSNLKGHSSGFTKRGISSYLNSDAFNNLNPSTQNTYKHQLKKLKEFRKEDLINIREIRKILRDIDNFNLKNPYRIPYRTLFEYKYLKFYKV